MLPNNWGVIRLVESQAPGIHIPTHLLIPISATSRRVIVCFICSLEVAYLLGFRKALVLRKLRKEGGEFKASLGYVVKV